MTVNIRNTEPAKDVFVSVVDRNAPQGSAPIPNQRINQGQQGVYLNIVADGNGNCLLDILVVDATDPNSQKAFPGQSCGDGGTISVDLF